MLMLSLAAKSLANRRGVALLTVFSIAVSVLLFLGVEKIRQGARDSFFNAIAGTDVMIGPRSGEVPLLLNAVFHVGGGDEIAWSSFAEIAKRTDLAWSVPLGLGDEHRGFTVLGTTPAYFERYKYRVDRQLAFAAGAAFADLFDAVLGADAAASLGLRVGDTLALQHLSADAGAPARPLSFRVSGILANTGTPVDRTIHISLAAREALRRAASAATAPSLDELRRADLTPTTISAAFAGMKSVIGVFGFQRFVNQYAGEPLMAVLPGVALAGLWSITEAVETALAAISAMVVVTALVAMTNTILSTLNARRREMAILRAVGARPSHIFALLASEAAGLAIAGTLVGVGALYLALWLLAAPIERLAGLSLPLTAPGEAELAMFAAIVIAGFLAGLIPALRAYFTSLGDGIVVRT
ncbi:MAG: ABC transporter permease [Bauldia sp.]